MDSVKLLGISLILRTFFVSFGSAWNATLWEHSVQRGESYTISGPDNKCIILSIWMRNKVSSVNTYGNCIHIYSRLGCRSLIGWLRSDDES